MDPYYKSTAGQGLSIAALILAVISLLVSFIPCIGLLAIIPGVVAIILSIVGLSQAQKENAAKGLVIAALIISIASFAISILWTVFFANAIQKNSWLKNQIEKAIEDETGSDESSKTWKDFGDNMEKKLENLELKTDSIDISINIGHKMSDNEFDKFIVQYEKLINQVIILRKKSETGDVNAVKAYTKESAKLNQLLTEIATNGSKLSRKQAQKIKDLNEKYQKELGLNKE